ncbi:MAG: binding-protein-dependent transport system inner rane component [Bradyrhizobium sp.]|nr:binding-protein-dependent transport system inner rane component [Bradyrhizobium sp.]
MDSTVAIPSSSATGSRDLRPKRSFDSMVILWIMLALLLMFLVINPLCRLIIDSFRQVGGTDFTLANYVAAFSRARHIQAVINTLWMASFASLIAVAMAVPLAWAVSRTDMPGRDWAHASVIAAFIIPTFLGAISWMLLAGPNAGWLNRIFVGVFGTATGPFNIFSFSGLCFVIGIYAFPLIYVFTRSALDLISTEMEEAAAVHGAGTLRTMLKVTLPLALPAILGGFILVFLEATALYGTPALIAIPARFNVATTQLATFFEHPLRVEVAAAFSMPMIGVTILLLWVQRLVLSNRSYVSVSGKGGDRRLVRLGPWKWLLAAYALLISLVTVLLPLLVLLHCAFAKAWGQGASISNLTLENFHHIFFEQLTVRQSMWNTFSYAAVTATACCTLGFGIAYIVQRRLLPLTPVLSFLTLSPVIIPGIVLAICFYSAYAGAPFYLYGSSAIIMVAFVTRFLPIAFVTVGSGIRSINPELEEAVRILGGNRLMVLRRVVAPLLKKTILGAWILTFVLATRELSTAVFLSGPETRVISVLTLDLSEQGRYEILAAMGVVLLVVTTVVVLAGMRVLGRDFMLRQP